MSFIEQAEEKSPNFSDRVFCLWKIAGKALVPTEIKWKRASLNISIFQPVTCRVSWQLG